MKANVFMGQHFLVSRAVLEKIVAAAELSQKDTVLEIGPGKGILTAELLKKAKKVVAIEKDKTLVQFLQHKFRETKKLEIIPGDALKPSGLINYNIKKAGYKVVANLPYYITSRFLRIFLEEKKNKPLLMVLMVQREVAKRICEKPPNMNLLALSVQAFGKPKIVASVPRSVFKPSPHVDSAVIKITSISNAFFEKNKIKPREFFAVIRKAFSQKRKMLRVSLGDQRSTFSTKRPQELSLVDWIKIIRSHKYR